MTLQSSNRKLKKFLFSVTEAILNGWQRCPKQFCKKTTQGPSQPSLVEFGSVVSEEKIQKFMTYDERRMPGKLKTDEHKNRNAKCFFNTCFKNILYIIPGR